MKELRRGIIIALATFILGSCGSYKSVITPAKESDVSLESHLISRDVEALIGDLREMPTRRAVITDYILFECDYQGYDYAQLTQFAESTRSDSLIYNHFQEVVAERENQILDHIDSLTINEIADYYRATPTEQIFLRPIISEAISTSIEDADYFYVRALRSIFTGTAIVKAIDPTYTLLRESMLKEVKAELTTYSKTEREIFNALKHNITVEITAYIEDNVDSAIAECFEDELPKEDAEIADFVSRTINNTLQATQMSSIFRRNMAEYNTIINQSREQITQSLLESPECHHLNGKCNSGLRPLTYNRIPLGNLHEISEIQNSINWLSLGLTAASFFTGGYLGLAIDAADFIYGASSGMSESEKLNLYMHNFSIEMRPILLDYYTQQVEALLKQEEQENSSRRNNFNEYIYENL